jgi:hypothetical protein
MKMEIGHKGGVFAWVKKTSYLEAVGATTQGAILLPAAR